MSHSTHSVLIARIGLVALITATLVRSGQTQFSREAIVVELRDGESAEYFARRHNSSVVDSTGNSYLMAVPPAQTSEMSVDPSVVRMEPDFYVNVSETAMPASVGEGLLNPDTVALLNNGESTYSGGTRVRKSLLKQPALDLIGCEDDERRASGSGIRVALIDTGVDAMHPALAGRILSGFNFIDGTTDTQESLPAVETNSYNGSVNVSMVALLNPFSVALLNVDMVALLNEPHFQFLGHGTLVAGLIRALAPDALFLPLKAFDESGHAGSFTVAKAIRYAADANVDVINMSFDFDQPSDVVREALDYAAAKGIILIASAGNNNRVADAYPAIHPAVIAVASTDRSDHKASFSNYGPAIDVAAPGDSLISTYPGGRYAIVAGTSFSAALVSGEAALVRSSGLFYADDVSKRIQKSSKNIRLLNPDFPLGSGRIRVSEALEHEDDFR